MSFLFHLLIDLTDLRNRSKKIVILNVKLQVMLANHQQKKNAKEIKRKKDYSSL